ncbi:MAG: dihydrofolate reductase, partial [Candidatus Puniceispirillales bacterium]
MTRQISQYPLVAIVAMAKNRVIGDGQQLLWHIPGDLPRVKSLTMGRPLIMGRRTFESIGRALPGRANIVLTRQTNWSGESAITVSSIMDAIAAAEEW